MAEFDASKTHLYRELEAAKIEQRISPIGEIGKIPEGQLRPLAALTPIEQPIAWQEANVRSDGRPTARVVEEVVREMRGEPREEWMPDAQDVFTDAKADQAVVVERRVSRFNEGLRTSATPEWYTPRHIDTQILALSAHLCYNIHTDNLYSFAS